MLSVLIATCLLQFLALWYLLLSRPGETRPVVPFGARSDPVPPSSDPRPSILYPSLPSAPSEGLEGVAVTQEVGRHVKGATGEIWFMDGGTGQRMPIKDWDSYLAKKLPSQPKPFPLQDHILRLFPVAQAPASAQAAEGKS